MMSKYVSLFLLIAAVQLSLAQNALVIPTALTGTTFNLDVQIGSKVFYTGTSTPTFGVNGPLLAPTIIVNKGDSITLNVTNNLPEATTMHWHGLHVSPQNDGGPDRIIAIHSTWSPAFVIRNNASTYWYHPHGAGKTERQVGKGIAGMLIVHDNAEMALDIPKTYGVDDFPLIVQTKEFDVLQQIAIAMEMDTALFVNGTLNAYLNAPAQVVRLRLLDGSSMRSFNFGFTGGQTFYQITTDGGLRDTPVALTRLRLSPGERADILVNLTGMTGQSLQFMSYSSGLPHGVYGGPGVGTGIDTIAGYGENFLNGTDFKILQINVVAATGSPVTAIPTSLAPFSPINVNTATVTRELVFDTIRLVPSDRPNLAEGPFGINDRSFNMDTINVRTYLNNTEIWSLQNHTEVAHPFHIHDVQFNIIEKSGQPAPASECGWKDVVLVMPHDSAKFITRFSDFADATEPYMYHCHLLHHEDDGMMGQYLVLDTTRTGMADIDPVRAVFFYPDPVLSELTIETNGLPIDAVHIYTIEGQEVLSIAKPATNHIDMQSLPNGMYLIETLTSRGIARQRVVKS